MNLDKHIRPRGRALLVQRINHGLRVEEAAQAAGVSFGLLASGCSAFAKRAKPA